VSWLFKAADLGFRFPARLTRPQAAATSRQHAWAKQQPDAALGTKHVALLNLLIAIPEISPKWLRISDQVNRSFAFACWALAPSLA
jgi:hypothetical protein